jgi:hypothetical protein
LFAHSTRIYIQKLLTQQAKYNIGGFMHLEIPKSIKLEHEELHEELEEATLDSGSVSVAAKAVEEILKPHFIKEEEFA